MKQHFSGGGATSQILKALAFLIESGCVYSTLLVIIAIALDLTRLLIAKPQIFVILYQASLTVSQAGPKLVFRTVATDYTYGCFVPLVVSRRPYCQIRPYHSYY